LRALDRASLPANIQVIQYPSIDHASRYPTLGAPTLESRAHSTDLANVNGLAGSIELYFGEDVLRQPDGSLRPVQWTSYVAGMKAYQGEVIEKGEIQKAFRAKIKTALANQAIVDTQDWRDIRKIVDCIRNAAQVSTS